MLTLMLMLVLMLMLTVPRARFPVEITLLCLRSCLNRGNPGLISTPSRQKKKMSPPETLEIN